MLGLSYKTTAGLPVEPEVLKTRYFPSIIRPIWSGSFVYSSILRIVIAEEGHAASLALRHEDFGKPGELAGVLAAGVKETVVKLSKVLAVAAALEGMDSSFTIKGMK